MQAFIPEEPNYSCFYLFCILKNAIICHLSPLMAPNFAHSPVYFNASECLHVSGCQSFHMRDELEVSGLAAGFTTGHDSLKRSLKELWCAIAEIC